jgi:hypothetical protein
MKHVTPANRCARKAVRVLFAFVGCASLPLLGYSEAPGWWAEREVIVGNAPLDDYAPVNQGQLKKIATAAIAELDATLAGGGGDALHALASSWAVTSGETNDFAPVNLGQLKSVAALFYDRMISAGIVDDYPWLGSLGESDDFAVANIGQVKNVFNFTIPTANGLGSPLGDRIVAGQFSANLALEVYAVWSWGDHFGNGSDFERNLPHRVNSLSAISSVSAGERHLVALRIDGTVLTWGENAAGQLGDGTNADRFTPGIVPSVTNIASIKAGGLHALALRQNGTVLAWGDNYYGQLGSGDTNSSSVPALVPGLDNVNKIAAGYQRSAALKTDGTVWVWGYDHYRDGDIFNPTPILIPGLTEVADIAAGYEHGVAAKADGTVWVWGSNYSNQLGNDSPLFIYQETPVQVPNLENIAKVASSYDHTLALANDGTVWAWGSNFSGQLGDGTNQARPMPVQVNGLTDVVAIATAYSCSLAMKSDGTLWAWGDGAVGTLPGSDPYFPQLVCLGRLDTNHNQMDDRWEMHFLGNLNQAANADFDGDGISNLQEYFHGTDPTDYFNGVAPVIEIASGNNQVGDPGAFLSRPFTVRVRNASGQLLINAPVNFAISAGGGGLSTAAGGSQVQDLLARTGSDGQVSVYHVLPQAAGTSTRTAVMAGPMGAAAVATFRGVVRYSPPPFTPPPPPPGSSPSPTASPTATPAAPYRYAVLDLGKNLYPIRINNQGWILFQGEDADGNWGYFRWKGGVMERLTFSEPNSEIVAKDMNDTGVVVGYFVRDQSWINNQVNEIRGGLLWSAASVSATKISAQTAVRRFEPQTPGTFKFASLNVIANSANPTDIYGQACTGTVRGFLNHTIMVMNGERWESGSTSPFQLSNASAVNNPLASDISVWQGSSDTISRANAARHYIGTKFTPNAVNPGFLGGTTSGMIDGQSISFDPVDINEGGIVVGNSSSGGSMVIRMPKPTPTPPGPPPSGSPQFTEAIMEGASPLAINSHALTPTQSSPGSSPQPSATPRPTPVPAPQILGWAGDALVLWELQSDDQTWHPFGLEEMIPSMDGWDSLDPYEMNDNGAIVGTGWYADPAILNAPSEQHAFILAPVEVMVDGNRDGKMSFDDRVVHGGDQTFDQRPYRFWLNNDSDGILDGEEIEGGSLDNADVYLKSLRDLEDFARLWITFRGIAEAVKNGGVTVQFEWKPNGGGTSWAGDAGNPAINVYKAVETDGGNRYLSDDATARNQVSYGNTPTEYSVSLGRVSRGQPLVVSASALGALSEAHPNKFFLFEGAAEGKGQLVLTFHEAGKKIGEYPPVYLHLSDVKKLYERAKVTSNPNPIAPPSDAGYPASDPPEPTMGWVQDPNENPPDHSLASWQESKQYIVLVHGWNMTYEGSQNYAETMFKRLWQRGYKGRFARLYWPTLVGLFTYNDSEYRAWKSGESLKQFMASLPPDYTKNLVSHSMGGVVCASALRQGMSVTNYALCHAAVPAACYDDSSTLDQGWGYTTPHYAPDQETRNLSYRYKLNSVDGNLISFFLQNDSALVAWEYNNDTPEGGRFSFVGSKPQSYGTSTTSYYYNPSAPMGQRLGIMPTTVGRFVSKPDEAMAYVAQSPTKAVGAEGRAAGSIDDSVDLNGYGFEDVHNAEYSFTTQKTKSFYNRLLEEFALSFNP